MEKNEQKKWLYKNKPYAMLQRIKNNLVIYKTQIENEDVLFEIPVDDVKGGTFEIEMEAHLLIRWL